MGDLFNFEKKSKIKAGTGLDKGQYKFFTSSPIQSKFLDEYIFDKESLIFGTGGLPSIHYCNEKFSTSTDCFVVTCKSEKILPKYVYYYLLGNMQILERGFKGAGLKHISKKYLQNIDIIYPTNLSKQREIINELSNIENLIEYKDESIELIDSYLNSIFLEMFGTPNINKKSFKKEKLGDIAIFKSGGTPSRSNNNYFDGDIPWITTVALGPLEIDYDDAIEYITEEAIEESSTKLIPENSVILGTRVGVGKVSINKCPLCTNQDIVSLIDIDSNINKIYLVYMFHFYEDFFEHNKRGATIKGITTKLLKNLEVPIPPIELQNQFAEVVQQIEKIKKYHSESKIELENLLNNLMQKHLKRS